jgi:hypothetical protein
MTACVAARNRLRIRIMNRLFRLTLALLLQTSLFWLCVSPVSAQEAASPARATRTESAELTDGSRSIGRVVSDPKLGVVFLRDGERTPISFERIRQIQIEGSEPEVSSGSPPFLIQLGVGNRLSGRLLSLDGEKVRLDPGLARPPWVISLRGVTAVLQRPGEVQILRDGFETIDPARWTMTGSPVTIMAPRLVGEHALKLPAGAASITTRLPIPLGSGRVELAYRDSAARVPGQRWFLDLTFRKSNGDQSTIRVIPGWVEETLALETPGGPQLLVQPLIRKEGWHRLAVQFDDERAAVILDGDDLAHGRGIGGPLIEVRIATETLGASQASDALAAVIDDLRIVRLVEPTGRFEVDPSQDEVRLVSGDQLFGKLGSCDADNIRLMLDGREIRLTWAEVGAIYPNRATTASSPINGIWVDAEWRADGGHDPRDWDRIEAVLSGADDSNVFLEVPYLGRILVPRSAMRRIQVQGRSTRIVLDVHAHHLGDRQSAEFDPPQAEMTPISIPFTLKAIPGGSAAVLLDVVKVIGEEGTPDFSERVKKGELRTSVSLNGHKLNDLNGFVSSRNETPERLRIAIPAGLLKVGLNHLTLDQNGTAAEPKLRDNLGILRMAIDFADENRTQP